MDNPSRRSFLKGAIINAAAMSGVPFIAEPPELHKEFKVEDLVPRLPLNLYLSSGLPDPIKSRISSLSGEIKIITGAGLEAEIKNAHAWFGPISSEELAMAGNLKWIQSPSAGVEHYALDELIKRDIILTNAKGCYAPAIGEHTIGLLFSLTRKLAVQARNMAQNKWDDNDEGMVEMKNMTMGIVGFGGIGRQVARRARAMDMRIIACDIVPMYKEQIGDLCEGIFLVQDGGFQKVLEQSDVIVCAAPHTKKSEGMLGPEEFQTMKKGAYFINVSRGKLVQTTALTQALREGHLAGAGLDVTDPEPLPPDHPLWGMPNVIITAHLSGRSQHSFNRMADVFIENIGRYIQGYPLLNIVNKQEGF